MIPFICIRVENMIAFSYIIDRLHVNYEQDGSKWKGNIYRGLATGRTKLFTDKKGGSQVRISRQPRGDQPPAR